MSEAASVPAGSAAPGDEAALVDRARAGDAAAVQTLVTRYLDDAYALAARMLRDPQRAADAAQDAFVSALGALPRFRGESSFRTWLLRIVVNSARSLARRDTRRREASIHGAVELRDPAADPEAQALARSEAERAGIALDGLSEKQRLAVTLRLHHGLSYREIGAVSNSSEGAARVNYHLGIKRLRELLR